MFSQVRTTGLFVLLVFLSACQNYKQAPSASIDTSSTSAFVCPPGSCAGAPADSNSLMITSARTLTVYYKASTEPSIQLSGDCYPSTYPGNRIDVYLNSTLISFNTNTVVEASSTSVVPRCIQGHYNIMINSSMVPTGSNIQLKMVGIDSAGLDHTGPTGSLNLKIYAR